MYKTFEDLPLTLDVSDIQEIMGIGRKQAYELVNSNKFPVVRLKRRIKVSKDVFIEWLHNGDKQAV